MKIFNYQQEYTYENLSINKMNWSERILRKLNIPQKASNKATLYHVVKFE